MTKETKNESYPIKIWSGILDPKHTAKIKRAIWVFLWFINRITLEKDNIGYVLGKRPVKLRELAEELDMHINTVSDHIDILRKGGYIETTRTPYGLSVRVLNSKKFNKKVIHRITENSESQKTVNHNFSGENHNFSDSNYNHNFSDNKEDINLYINDIKEKTPTSVKEIIKRLESK